MVQRREKTVKKTTIDIKKSTKNPKSLASMDREEKGINEYPLYKGRVSKIDLERPEAKPSLEACLMEFDEDYYFSAYPDVKTAVQKGALMSALEHFRKFGYDEGRKHKE